MSKLRIIVGDDHQVVRQGLRDMLARTTDLEVAAEAADGVEAERLARTLPADMLLLDVSMPRRRGVQVLEALRADGITLPVLFFSMYPPEQYLDYARRAGAQGFVSKSADSAELVQAIRRIAAGGTSFPRRVQSGHQPNDPTRSGSGNPFDHLSRREIEVMQGLLQGDSLVQIATTLDVSAKSVSTYRRRILDKLDVHSNAELAALAALHGQP
ncbi:MAG: response regulator transcription factor [Rhodocyclaceae bacterium]|nr:response regulator transcription factor [Rhodocyclaceae bacterium]